MREIISFGQVEGSRFTLIQLVYLNIDIHNAFEKYFLNQVNILAKGIIYSIHVSDQTPIFAIPRKKGTETKKNVDHQSSTFTSS